MDEQRELERRVRGLYELARGQEPRTTERKTPAAALDALLRAAEAEEPSGPDGEPVKVHSLSGAFSPAAARRGLAVAGRPFATGVLLVTDGLRDLGLLFTPSGLKVLGLGFRFPALSKRLLEKGRVATGQLNRLEAAVKRHRGEQEALVALGVPADLVGEVACETAAQVVLDAMFWSDPTFEALAGEADAEVRDRRDVEVLTLSSKHAKALVQAVNERVPELQAVHRALPTLSVPLSEGPRVSEKSGSLSGRAVEILTVVSKRAGVRAAEVPERLAEAGLAKPPLHALAREVHELVAKGLLVAGKPGAVEERVGAPDAGLSPLARRLRLAKVLSDAGDRPAAARHLSRAGTDLLARGRPAEAARCLAAAHALHGEDLEAHDGYVKALVACDRRDEARAEAEALARRYLDTRLPARARRSIARALQEREELPLLLLQLEALVALGEARPIADAAEKVLLRLKQGPLRAEAQRLADALADQAADVPGRDRILRAGGGGVGSPLVGRVMVGVVAALAVALVPALLGMKARTAYARAAADAGHALKADPLAFGRVKELFRPLEARGGAVGDAARQVVQRADEHAQDWEALLAVKRALGRRDVDLVLQRCAETRPHAPSMQALIDELAEEARARRAEALAATEELGQLVAREQFEEAYACARRLLEVYGDAPGVLAGLSLPVRVSSTTPGAALRWNKAVISQPLPFSAPLPLLEERHLEVSAPGHEPLLRVLRVADLSGPEVRVTLRPAGAAPEPPPAPPRASSPDGPVSVRDGVLRGGGDDPRLVLPRFTPGPGGLDDVSVPDGWRARVDLVHEVQDGQVVLVSLSITLEERQANGTWLAERSLSAAVRGGLVRGAVGAEGRAPPPVPPFDRTPGLDVDWMREQVRKAVQVVMSRRRSGGR